MMFLVALQRGLLVQWAAALMLATAAAGQTASDPKPLPPSEQRFLSWLPSDTETMIVARNFSLPDLTAIEKKEKDHTQESLFAQLALGSWGINRSLADYFRNEKVSLAIGGSRKFRRTKGFGLMPFEGCSFILFADHVRDRPERYFKAAASGALRIEEIERRSILVFEDKSQQDTWMTFVGFADPDVLLVATNIGYLREVLSRIRGRNGPRALPETLPEWGYVNTSSQFWGLRHFDPTGRDDPSSPFWDASKIIRSPWTDRQAIGLTFSYDPAAGKRSVVTYLSGNPSAGKGPLSLYHEGSKFGVTIRESDARAIEASYNLGHPEGIMFLFYLGHFLGHGIVV